MANWVVESGNFTLNAEQAVNAVTYVDLTISSVVDGIWNGYHLSASNFKIGGVGAASPAGTWTGGNVDDPVTSVTFSDIGVAGDPANTVKARVALASNYNPAITPTTIYVDIDEVATIRPVRSRSVYLTNKYNTYASGQTISLTSTPTVGLSYAMVSDIALDRIDLVTGDVDEGKFSLVSKILFTSSSTHFYKYEPTVSFVSLGDYEGDYFATVDTVKTSGSITSFTVKIFYQPNALRADSNEDLRQVGHTALINYELQAKSVAVTNTIAGLSYRSSAPYLGGNQSVTVLGTSGSVYTIGVHEKESLTSGTDFATTANYYNFTTKAFESTFSNKLAKIKSNGADHHGFTLPTVNSSTRYDIIIEAAGPAPLPTIASSIAAPVANSITQYGRGVLTIQPTKLVNTGHAVVTGGDAGAVSTKAIKRPIRYVNDKYTDSKPISINATCSTKGGSSSSRLTLNRPNPKILSGMIVSGGAVAHSSTVKTNVNGVITLDRASAVASDTLLNFAPNDTNLVAFSFNIASDGAAGRIVNIASGAGEGVNAKYPIGGLEAVSILTNGTISNGDHTMVLDNVQGLAVGMTASGANVQLDLDGNQPTITAITDLTTIELSSVQSSVVDDTVITFDGSGLTDGTHLRSISLFDNGDDVSISGYIEVGEVIGSITLPIDLDTLLTIEAP